MPQQALKAHLRKNCGTRPAQALHATGHLPGIIYGHGETPVAFSVACHELEVELLHRQRLLSLDLEGKQASYLIREVQYDHLGMVPVHIDLVRVDLHETIRLQVAIELVGTPKGTSGGGVLEQQLQALQIECTAATIPGAIKARVHDLDVGDTLTVGKLELPPGVRVLHDPSELVATVRVLAEQVEPVAVESEAGTEPEVITKGKGEEEEKEKAD